MTEQTLAGQIALVTGAGRGIGRAIALAYAQAGAVVCCAARTRLEIEATVDTIRQTGGRGVIAQMDVTQYD